MTRGGRKVEREAPERRCIATGESGGTAGLVRFVLSPEGEIVPDLAGRLPGRGIWVSADAEALALAVRRNLFSRAAKAAVRVPDGLVARVESLLAQRLVDLLGLARKAGAAVAGHDRVRDRLKAGPVAALVEASDGSERGRAGLRPLAGAAPVVDCLTASELGMAFGRDRVIHAALETGGISDRVLREARRLAGFRRVTQPSGAACIEE